MYRNNEAKDLDDMQKQIDDLKEENQKLKKKNDRFKNIIKWVESNGFPIACGSALVAFLVIMVIVVAYSKTVGERDQERIEKEQMQVLGVVNKFKNKYKLDGTPYCDWETTSKGLRSNLNTFIKCKFRNEIGGSGPHLICDSKLWKCYCTDCKGKKWNLKD